MKRLWFFLFVVCVTSCGTGSLTVIHLNDTHSQIDPFRGGNESGCGGVIERAAIVDSVRKADGKSNVLLLHAGDFSQGSSYFTELNGDLEIEILNRMRYDCVNLGNHEFDRGIDDLARRLSALHCPVVCANYDFSGMKVGKYVRPYAIIHRAGMKIGVVGLLADVSTAVKKSVADSLVMMDAVESVNEWASHLKRDKACDLVIMLSHVGFEMLEDELSDVKIVPQTRDVDLVIGGHSHSFLDDIVYVKNADGKEIPIVQEGKWGVRTGILKVTRN